MFEFFFLIAVIFPLAAIAAPILAIIALSRTNALARQLREIRQQLGMEQAPLKPKAEPQTKPQAQPLQQPTPTKKEPPKPKAPPKPTTTPAQPKASFEERFGARLPVWIGAVAFVLAGDETLSSLARHDTTRCTNRRELGCTVSRNNPQRNCRDSKPYWWDRCQ